MADSEGFATQDGSRYASRSTSHPEMRPLPFRATTEPNAFDWNPNASTSVTHTRRKSTYTFSGGERGRGRSTRYGTPRSIDSNIKTGPGPHIGSMPLSPVREQSVATAVSQLLTPPVSPDAALNTNGPESVPSVKVETFDFSKIDYELSRARCIGRGLWSSVYLAEPVINSPRHPNSGRLTPPRTPEQSPVESSPRLFAVKTAARPDAKDVFRREGEILTRLQCSASADQRIVTFHGLDQRNSALVFEGVIGGSLEDLVKRLNVMTELARHLELRSLFAGLASDLIGGLRFIHSSNIIHADIKPTNVLLDITDSNDLEGPVLRARYIDFSASFVAGEYTDQAGGGTWDYLAPEQLQTRKDISTPTFASDVWSLGITLLSTIVGRSPYTAVCGDNVFMLREAIKRGDPLGFARSDIVIQRRIDACQDFVDCCRLALQKERDRRFTAAAWEASIVEM